MGQKLKIQDYTTAEFQDKYTDEELFNATKDGVPDSKMKGYGKKLSDEQINDLVVLMRSFKKE